MTTGKTIALTRWTFVGKVMYLLFNMLSRLVITFLPRSKHLLISWLQSPSVVILEPPKIKSLTVSIISPSTNSLPLHHLGSAAAAAAKSLQSCPTLCDPTDGSPSGSPVPGILQSLLQHHSSKALILQRSAFFIVQLSHPYMTTGKAMALTRRASLAK